MTQKSPPRHPPAPDQEPASGPAPREEDLDPATAAQDEALADPYDDLWDPDMDTRPERIKRTKARPRLDSRTRGRPTPRGRRREEA